MIPFEVYNHGDLEDDRANAKMSISDSYNSNKMVYSSKDKIVINSNASPHMINICSRPNVGKFSENESNWAQLPSLVVEKIYSFLKRPDQSRMSQVCFAWSKEFGSPSVWKAITFYLPEHDYSSAIYPEVKFARKYGCMFRHVEIICRFVENRLIGVIWSQLCWFLQAMESSSQLISIKFVNMGDYFCRLEGILYQELFRTVIAFFNSQQNLKTVAFQDSRLSREEGMELLKSIFHSSNSTIISLNLKGFVSDDELTLVSSGYTKSLSEICCRIAKVRFLELDYTKMFEDIMNCLHDKLSKGDKQLDNMKYTISNLNIFCDGKNHSSLRGVLPETWECLTSIFSDLKVKMDLAIHSDVNKLMETFLVRGIPLKSLYFRYEKFSYSSRIDLKDLFTHFRFCKYQDHLKELNVSWESPIDDFPCSVISFVESCKYLQTFNFSAIFNPSEFE